MVAIMSRDARARAKQAPTEAPVETVTKPIGGEKNGGTRTIIVKKGPKWYPADDVKKPVPSRKHKHNPTKLRPSIKPGTVLILLAGHHRGSRVIFLKQLPSGLLLVTGPYSVNRVPIRRVDQAYVIATSTVVNIASVDCAKFDDSYFKKEKKSRNNTAMEVDEEDKSEAKKPTAERIADQKAIDTAILPALEKDLVMVSYLKTKFTLKKGQYPHEMKF